MTLIEVTTELTKVNAAIDAITGTGSTPGAQTYSIGNRSLTRGALSELYRRKRELEILKTRLSSTDGGAVSYPLFGTRS